MPKQQNKAAPTLSEQVKGSIQEYGNKEYNRGVNDAIGVVGIFLKKSNDNLVDETLDNIIYELSKLKSNGSGKDI